MLSATSAVCTGAAGTVPPGGGQRSFDSESGICLADRREDRIEQRIHGLTGERLLLGRQGPGAIRRETRARVELASVDQEVLSLEEGGGSARAASGTFDSVSVGGYHTCGVAADGSVACWGSDGYGVSSPPEGEFASVSAGTYYTCGVRTDGTIACWGLDEDGQATPPAGEFASVSAGTYQTCGVKTAGSIACWGRDPFDRPPPSPGTVS